MAHVIEAGERIAQLRDYFAEEVGEADAEFCLRWLAACALCPVLRWPLTISLGNALADGDRRARPDEDLVLAIARLPWFRSGRMPDELREELAATLDRADRRTVRTAFATAFEAALGEPGQAAPRRPDRSGAQLARLVGRLPDGELADPLLATGLRARRAGRLLARIEARRFNLPPGLRWWLQAPRIAAVLAIAGAMLAASWTLPGLDALLQRRAGEMPVTIDIARLRLGACSGPAGAWGDPSFAAGAVQLQTALLMERVAPGDGFATALIAPDFGAVLTQDARGEGTLWSLAGDGARALPDQGREALPSGGGPAGSYTLRRVGDRPTFFLQPPDAGAPAQALPALAQIEFSSREDIKLVAVRSGAAIVVRNRASGAEVARITAGGSPLLGLGKTRDDLLAVATCDPNGRIKIAPVTKRLPPSRLDRLGVPQIKTAPVTRRSPKVVVASVDHPRDIRLPTAAEVVLTPMDAGQDALLRQPSLAAIGFPNLFEQARSGRVVRVAVVGSGHSQLPQFGKRLVQDGPLPGNGPAVANGADQMRAYGDSIVGLLATLAPTAEIHSIPVLNSQDSASEPDLLTALEGLLRGEPNDVVLITLGPLLNSSAMRQALEALSRRAVVVIAAGNEGEQLDSSKAAPGLLVVGAADGDERASYSNYGDGVIFAPGRVNTYGAPNQIEERRGTGYAATIAAAAAANFAAITPEEPSVTALKAWLAKHSRQVNGITIIDFNLEKSKY